VSGTTNEIRRSTATPIIFFNMSVVNLAASGDTLLRDSINETGLAGL
jgi:hypothetical protein